MNPTSRLLVSCGLGIFAFSAHAAPVTYSGEATATLQSLTFTLIDLAPGDGIDPSFYFLPTIGSSLSSQAFSGDGWNPSDRADSSRTKLDGFLSSTATVQATTGDSTAVASFDGHNLAASSSYSVLDDGSSYWISAYSQARFGLEPAVQLNITLGANTALQITADVALSAVRSSACLPYCRNDGSGYAAASVSLSALSYYATPLTFSSPEFRNVTVSAVNGSQALSDVLNFTIYNYSGMEGSAIFNAQASTWANSYVPEPQAWVLTMAGLGMVAWTAGCKARHRQG